MSITRTELIDDDMGRGKAIVRTYYDDGTCEAKEWESVEATLTERVAKDELPRCVNGELRRPTYQRVAVIYECLLPKEAWRSVYGTYEARDLPD